jgi:hypothetical protein
VNCVRCGSVVDSERAEALTEFGIAVTCKSCSTEMPRVCFMDYSHKTAPSLVVVGNNAESVRLASNAFKRKR